MAEAITVTEIKVASVPAVSHVILMRMNIEFLCFRQIVLLYIQYRTTSVVPILLGNKPYLLMREEYILTDTFPLVLMATTHPEEQGLRNTTVYDFVANFRNSP